MDRSVALTEWKPEASARKHWQVTPAQAAPELGPETPPTMLDIRIIERCTFNGALIDAARSSGKEDQEIAEEIHISPGYMSRFMRGVGQQWARRLVAFMHSTNSRAPLQWIAHQVGCEVVLHSAREARLRQLEAEIRELRSPA